MPTIQDSTQKPQAIQFGFHARWLAVEIRLEDESTCPIWEAPIHMLEVQNACNSARKVPQEYLEYAGRGCTHCQLVVTEATQAEAVKAHPDYWKCPHCGRTAAHTWDLDARKWL
jgi:hypothetical protein